MIEINNLKKVFFKDNNELVVLKNINFSIKKGEFIVIIGPSGCGKSTLLKIIGGLIKPTNGNIKINKQKVSFVFQEPNLFPWRSIKQNILLPIEVGKGNKKNLEEIFKLIKLKKFENHHPFEISGGMRQKVAIARALISGPEILLMDEPFSNLDEISRTEFNEEILKISKQLNLTTIFITHSISEAVYLADRIIVLSKIPSNIKKEIKIKFNKKQANIKESKEFLELVKCLRKEL